MEEEVVNKKAEEDKKKKVGEDHYTVGYSSYYLDYVIDWLNNCFEFFVKCKFKSVIK